MYINYKILISSILYFGTQIGYLYSKLKLPFLIRRQINFYYYEIKVKFSVYT